MTDLILQEQDQLGLKHRALGSATLVRFTQIFLKILRAIFSGCLESLMTSTKYLMLKLFFLKFYDALVLRGFQSLFCVNFLVQRFLSLNNIAYKCMPEENK